MPLLHWLIIAEYEMLGYLFHYWAISYAYHSGYERSACTVLGFCCNVLWRSNIYYISSSFFILYTVVYKKVSWYWIYNMVIPLSKYKQKMFYKGNISYWYIFQYISWSVEMIYKTYRVKNQNLQLYFQYKLTYKHKTKSLEII